jgi:hypothetical protein
MRVTISLTRPQYARLQELGELLFGSQSDADATKAALAAVAVTLENLELFGHYSDLASKISLCLATHPIACSGAWLKIQNSKATEK